MRFDTFFSSTGIEYYAVADIKNVRLTKGELLEREDFVPRSVILFLVPYYTLTPKNISRYAASRDYHIYLKEIGNRLSSFLKERIPEISCKGYGDHSPIDERHAAAKCALGVIGDNGLLINEKYGSYVFIADLVTDAPASLFGEYLQREPEGCEHCAACISACPTGRLADRTAPCLSAVTQKRGELSDDEAELIKRTGGVWGCDACQEVCPHNVSPIRTPIEFFHEARIEGLTKEILLDMNEDEFSERAFAWRGRKTLLRNLDIASIKNPDEK
jgi:epoxyqueuosine reductase